MKILDTDHCVAVLRGRLRLGQRAASDEVLATTVITVAELVHGAHRSERPTESLSRVNALLARLTVLPMTEKTARLFGRLRAEFEASGKRLDDLDLEIASIALVQQVPLLTHNRKHFERIDGLVIEDWLAENR